MHHCVGQDGGNSEGSHSRDARALDENMNCVLLYIMGQHNAKNTAYLEIKQLASQDIVGIMTTAGDECVDLAGSSDLFIVMYVSHVDSV